MSSGMTPGPGGSLTPLSAKAVQAAAAACCAPRCVHVYEHARVACTSPAARRVDARHPFASWRGCVAERHSVFESRGAVVQRAYTDVIKFVGLMRGLTDGHNSRSSPVRLAERSRHFPPEAALVDPPDCPPRAGLPSAAHATLMEALVQDGACDDCRTAITSRAWRADSRASSLIAAFRPRYRAAAG